MPDASLSRWSRGAVAPGARRGSKGFTLIELLVVVSIIAALIALMVPALANSRQRAYTVACSSKIKSIYTASLLYAQDYRVVPASRGDLPVVGNPPPPHAPAWGWWRNRARDWARGPGFVTSNMSAGYLPKLKEAAWCPAKTRDDFNGQMFWNLSIDDKEWGLDFSPYAGNGQRFDSLTQNHYDNGGAINLAEWDRYHKAYYLTETAGGNLIQTGMDVDGGVNNGGRHLSNVLVLIADGHVVEMRSRAVFDKINSDDREFCWGE